MSVSEVCSSCGAKCCRSLPPVLTDEEVEFFKREFGNEVVSEEIRNDITISVLSKKEGSQSCIFLNDKNNQCTIYSDRPLNCQFFPVLPRIKPNYRSLLSEHSSSSNLQLPNFIELRIWFCPLTDAYEDQLLASSSSQASLLPANVLIDLNEKLEAVKAFKRKKRRSFVRE